MSACGIRRSWCRRSRQRFFMLVSASAAIMFVYMLLLHNKELIAQSSLPDVLLGRNKQQVSTKEYPEDEDEEPFQYPPEKQACVQPKLELYPNKEFVKFFSDTPKPSCGVDENWIVIENGTFRMRQTAKDKHGHITCDYLPILRGKDDFTYNNGDRIRAIQDGWKVTSDVSKISCFSDKGRYENYHAAVPYVAELQQRSRYYKLPIDATGLDVLMFGFDSVSRLTWIRKLPKTYAYMINVLKCVVLEGYNIVGDGTPQALLPILTGKTEPELPEARRGHPGATTVDGHPWIWKEFKEAGYVTQWTEDGASYGTFHYRMLGFKESPVDHYIRHFQLEIEKHRWQNKPYCLGSDLRHNVMFNWVTEFFKVYKHGRKFSFTFHSECSHDSNNPLSMVDEDFKRWLEYLYINGFLNNTLLILMSDHGARFQNLRETVQGKQEERNPFFSFRLPTWFKEKYPRAFNNLRINSKRLTTPFDIHATFRDVLNFRSPLRGNVSERGISLFSEIPASRSCDHAKIEPHWCNCLNWKSISEDSSTVKKAAKAFLDLVNSLTERVRENCHLLEIDNITESVAYSPGSSLLKFKASSDHDGRVPDLSSKTKSDVSLYQLTIHTKPGGGHFEATVKHDLNKNIFTLSTGEVSRINKYGDAPACIASQLPHLRQFCVCKSR
ncbi:uncharacterized protein LOC135494597 [Lineus longissimus]|uniref:uncharacterized protein LOC135494597 n=1 Tax=Lineus longissimus TaxID=88925 RepID=UPI002B4D0F33